MSPESPTTTDLERALRDVAASVTLPQSLLVPDAPPALRFFDDAAVRRIAASATPVPPEREGTGLADVLAASGGSRALWLAGELDLLRLAREGNDIVHKGPHGLLEIVCPVKVRNRVVQVVRSGKFRATAFTAEQLKEIAFLSDKPLRTVQEAAALLPVWDKATADAMQSSHARIRDAIAVALREHLKGIEGRNRLIKADNLASLGTMADGMARHMDQMLASALGSVSKALEVPDVPPEAAEWMGRAAEAAQRGRRFADQIVLLAGARTEPESTLSVHDRLNGVLDLMEPRLPPGARIVRSFEARNDTVTAPGDALHQMLFSLVSCSMESIAPEAVLSVRTSDATDTREFGPVPCIRIEMIDETSRRTGVRTLSGRRALDTLAGESAGPALSNLFGFASRLDGAVTVESAEDGAASRTEILLPRGAGSGKVKRLAPGLVWIVDDDPNLRELCRRTLTGVGHQVDLVETGTAFIRNWGGAARKPDLLVVDFNMPDRSGPELVAWLRDQGQRTPVILLGGHEPDHPLVEQAVHHRKTFYLRKPFTSADLADKATIALGETLIGG